MQSYLEMRHCVDYFVLLQRFSSAYFRIFYSAAVECDRILAKLNLFL